MKAAALRRWSFVHTWSSLICTVFLLAICVTGLPLIFSSEIDRLSDDGSPYAAVDAMAAPADADGIIAHAQHAFPSESVRYIYWPDDQPVAVVGMAPSDDSGESLYHSMKFDAQSGLERKREAQAHGLTFMDVMGHLHEDLFLGLPGELFLGAMALLFVAAIVSGVVLYAPFMRHVKFGEHRAAPGSRLAWLDLHNALSAVALLWMTVLGITGIVNELATPLFAHWIATDVRNSLPARPEGPPPAHLASVTAAMHRVEAQLPGRKIQLVDFPTLQLGNPNHYVLWTQGKTPLTSRLSVPAFVDAVSGEFAGAAPLPWYLLMLEVSRPLHFGDYGGLPLKIIWALFDLLTIVVLISGLRLWVGRRRLLARRRTQLELHSAEPTP